MFWQYFFTLLSLSILLVGFIVFVIFVFFPVAFIIACWYMRIKERKMQRRKLGGANVAFFHPYCNAGGGGERVLWVAIKALLVRYPETNIYIYTVETAEPKKILDKVQNTFNVKIDPEKINFIWLKMNRLIEAKTYPYFTIILQSLGSMVLGLEAFMKLNPDVYIDTTGFAFTFPIFRYLAACPVGCYVHYPTITGAMMTRVKHRISAYNNSSFVARNPIFTWLKLIYYKIFGWLYGVVGRCADVVMVNGAWTEEHLYEIWRVSMHRVYPPCEVGELKQLHSLVKDKDPLRLLSVAQLQQQSDQPMTRAVDDLRKEVLPDTVGESERERRLDSMLQDMDPIRILSVAQFRPEKDHPLMLQAMYELRTLLHKNELLWSKIKLVLVGSCRNAEDEERVRNLKDLASHLALDDNVSFVVNASYGQLLTLYQTSTVALHAMANEHFGISVVECMAAGLVTIAHRSGGPLYDIIETSAPSRTGFLAAEAEEYARAILEVIALWPAERQALVKAARASVDRFSTPEFEKCFLRVVEPLMET